MTRRVAHLALFLILAIGATVRLLAARAPLEGIEAYEFIPTAMTFTLAHHPIRAAQHGAVPAYLIRGSSLVFGETTLGFRAGSVIAGTATILLLYLVAARWWGRPAGLIAAALLSVERYHTEISARAIDLPFDLFFNALAIYAMSRFLAAAATAAPGSGRWLYGVAAAAAGGFLCKEFTALLLPVVLTSMALSTHRGWLRRREPWLAAALFAVLIAPDLYSSLTVTQAEREDLFARQKAALRQQGGDLGMLDYEATGLYMSYGDQLSRFKAVGFDREPFYFYFGDVLDRLGVAHENSFDEFPFLHPVMGITLWVGTALAFGMFRRQAIVQFLAIAFVGMFVPFCLVQIGTPRAAFETDNRALWYWVDRTMLPAILLTAAAAAALVGQAARPRTR